jgi:hypothetical protein
MTTPRTPRPEPGVTRPRPPPPPQPAADSAGTARIVALVALVIAAIALGLTAWHAIASPATASCQQAAWDTTPATADLPADWTVSATQYDISRKTISYLGPQPSDSSSNQAVIYATVTCFDQGAADSVTRSAQAAKDAGQSVVDRSDLGDGGFSAADDTGATFLQLRHDKIVVYLAGSGDASSADVDQLASAFDKALGGDGGAVSPANPQSSGDLGAVDSSDPNASGASDSPAAPDLVARIPTKVGDVTLTPDSATGSTILGEDQGSRAILAALRAAGKQPDDLRVAQAYDDSGNSDLSVMVVTVDGMPIDKVKSLVLDSWLTATGPGVTHKTVQLAGKDWEQIDYGDQGSKDYVRVDGNDVIVITSSDQAQADKTAAGIK